MVWCVAYTVLQSVGLGGFFMANVVKCNVGSKCIMKCHTAVQCGRFILANVENCSAVW